VQGAAGIVYARSTGRNQDGDKVLDYACCAMVQKRQPGATCGSQGLPSL